MRGVIVGTLLFSLLLSSAWDSSVAAQAEPFGYRPAVELALSEYREGHFEEARAEFRRAHALFPNARTLRGIGMAEFELRNYGDSVKALREALQSQARPLEGDLRAETETLLSKALNYVARITLDLQPEATSVTVDGAVVTPDANHLLLLRVGDHVLEFRAEGRVPERRELRVNGGEEQTLQVVLSEPALGAATTTTPIIATLALAASTPAPDAATTEEGPSASPLPWIITGASAAVMIGGIVLVAMAQSDIAKVEDAKDGTEWSELQSAYDGAPLKSGIGITMIGLGLAGVGAGVFLLMTGSDSDDHDSTQVAVGLGSASITGRF